MDVCEMVVEGIFNEIGARVVGFIVLSVGIFFWVKQYTGGRKVRQKQKAGNKSKQMQIADNTEILEQEQVAGDESNQVQKEGR